MTVSNSGPNPAAQVELTTIREIFGYLNFSSGAPDTRFQANWNCLYEGMTSGFSTYDVRQHLFERLAELKAESELFRETNQAEAVLSIVFDNLLPRYREFHSDLLFHLDEDEFYHPLFIVRLIEAVLDQSGAWDERERIVENALPQLNDFLGFRPIAVLENERELQSYEHERFRPVPIFIKDAGAANGPYRELLERTIAFFNSAPSGLLDGAFFRLEMMDELAVDVRAHDHLHPVNKRTNYMFGEWDPHQINTRGFYNRFIVRKIILDALLQWMDASSEADRDELLYDASAVLCGTILMASSISGYGPDTHDSSVTLTSLLPKVARQRDQFYARLLQEARGPRAARLRREAELTQQPFGHVRQHLNMILAKYGARQVQNRHIATLYARIGNAEAARDQALLIPSVSSRFECEIQWRLTSCQAILARGKIDDAYILIQEIRNLLKRGIECGGLVDPWNILGFQGNFPLFSSREDAVPDQRVESLLALMEQYFQVFGQLLGEAAAAGRRKLAKQLSAELREAGEAWDRYATTTVADLPQVFGVESWKSAQSVSRALSEWRAAGESCGDISFWRQHVEHFETAEAYARVVDSLLGKRDHIAARGLLMQWLSQADDVRLESGPHSINRLLLKWMHQIIKPVDDELSTDSRWVEVKRLFDYVEANAGEFWDVPRISDVTDDRYSRQEPELDAFSDMYNGGEVNDLDDEEDDEENVFQAAYDDVVFRDSAHDGVEGETVDGSFSPGNTEFEVIGRRLESRIKFLNTLAQLWQVTGATFAADREILNESPDDNDDTKRQQLNDRHDTIIAWRHRAGELYRDLHGLMTAVWEYEVSTEPGDLESNLEYDLQIQSRDYLLQNIIVCLVNLRAAGHHLFCCLPEYKNEQLSQDERLVVNVYRAVFRRDAAEVRRLLPPLMSRLSRKPLLYVPLDHGGHPRDVLGVRITQELIRTLLSELPKLGMMRENWHLLRLAHRMERTSRPRGQAVTEYDRLFRTALDSTVECIVEDSEFWKSGRFSDEDLIEIIGEIVERYLDQWLRHSDTMRLSQVETLMQENVWSNVRGFIEKYGHDLFHARMLTLGNVRTILHNGIDNFLDFLCETDDPVSPSRLVEDLQTGTIDREEVVQSLEMIYGCVVDRFDRFLEYNTTTTQSDYGEMFHCLLDFLRVETEYDREDWNLLPIRIAHEILCRRGKHEASLIWEHMLQTKTDDSAMDYLKSLEALETQYGMRMPTVTDHLKERFIKPLAVNRMIALVPDAIEEASHQFDGDQKRKQALSSFESLRQEIDSYLEDTTGSGIEVPSWLRAIERAIDQASTSTSLTEDHGFNNLPVRSAHIGLSELQEQLRHWNDPLQKRRRKRQSD